MFKRLLLVVLLVGCSGVRASNWQYLGFSTNAIYNVDVDSIEKLNYGSALIKAWVKTVFKKDSNLSRNGKDIFKYSSEVALTNFDCSGNKLETTQTVFYSRSGASYSLNSYTGMQDAIPDSVGENWVKSICNMWIKKTANDDQIKQQKIVQEETALKDEIAKFSADPSHKYFQILRPKMAILLSSGQARDLQDAYDQAMIEYKSRLSNW